MEVHATTHAIRMDLVATILAAAIHIAQVTTANRATIYHSVHRISVYVTPGYASIVEAGVISAIARWNAMVSIATTAQDTAPRTLASALTRAFAKTRLPVLTSASAQRLVRVVTVKLVKVLIAVFAITTRVLVLMAARAMSPTILDHILLDVTAQMNMKGFYVKIWIPAISILVSIMVRVCNTRLE